MKRRLIAIFIVPLVLVLFALFNTSSNIYAQGGDARLKPDPKPAPKGGKVAAKPAGPAALEFNQEKKSRLDPRTEKFEEYVFDATSADLLSFKLESENTTLELKVFDKDKNEIALSKSAAVGEFKIANPNGALPADGEYRVRVGGAITGRLPIAYSVKIVRLGLTTAAYNERLQNILRGYREKDAVSAEKAITDLETLVSEDSTRSSAFELLGLTYLYHRRDFAKAEQAMEQALTLKGAAVVRITYDLQWRRMEKLRTGKIQWREPREGRLRILPGKLTLFDENSGELVSLTGAQITSLARTVTENSYFVTLSVKPRNREFVFGPSSLQAAEADLVVKLIEKHVMGKKP